MSTAPPLRADAERNRQKLLAAARELFCEQGLDVTLDDIARRAGVGVGTAYRRFANKDEVIDELLVERVDEMRAIAERHLADPDPLEAIRGYLEEAVALQVADRGLKQVLFAQGRGKQRVAESRARLAPAVGALLDRAKAAGAVRGDVLPSDVAMMSLMLSVVVDFARGRRDDLHRRYLGFLVEGLRPGGPPAACPPMAMPEFGEAMAEFRFGDGVRPRRGGC